MGTATNCQLTQEELDMVLRGLLPEKQPPTQSEFRKKIIATLFERWIVFYGAAMYRDVEGYMSSSSPLQSKFSKWFDPNVVNRRHATLARMNSGDCGTTALAIGQVLEQLGFEVNYCDLYDHACIIVDDCYYDALEPTGVTERSEVFGYRSEGINGYTATIGSAALIHEQYLRVDPLGVLLVESFAKMFLLDYTYPFKIEA